MEKVAILIGAYQNPDYLDSLIQSLLCNQTNIYISINKYNEHLFADLINKYKDVSNVTFYSNYKIRWGGYVFFYSQLFILSEALKNADNVYFHYIAGQDMLVRPLKELINFSFDNIDKNFVEIKPFDNPDWIPRYRCYNFIEHINYKKNIINKLLYHLSMKIQGRLHLYRQKLPFDEMKCGSTWWSINRAAANYIIDYFNDEKHFKALKYTFAPDEVYYASILYNSPFRDSLAGKNLYYLKWEGGGGPQILTELDYEAIIDSKMFFARKIDKVKSKELIKLINRYKEAGI